MIELNNPKFSPSSPPKLTLSNFLSHGTNPQHNVKYTVPKYFKHETIKSSNLQCRNVRINTFNTLPISSTWITIPRLPSRKLLRCSKSYKQAVNRKNCNTRIKQNQNKKVSCLVIPVKCEQIQTLKIVTNSSQFNQTTTLHHTIKSTNQTHHRADLYLRYNTQNSTPKQGAKTANQCPNPTTTYQPSKE